MLAGKGSALDHLGRPATQFGLAGAFYGAGTLAGSEKARRAGAVGAAALAANGVATWALKSAVGRRRPFTAEGSRRWDGFGEGYESMSFPSGHTSNAFAMAAVVAEEYDSPWVDGLSYGVAGAVGLSRVHQDQHWASDVLAGAALGYLIGKGVSRWERRAGWARFLYSDGRGAYLRIPF